MCVCVCIKIEMIIIIVLVMVPRSSIAIRTGLRGAKPFKHRLFWRIHLNDLSSVSSLLLCLKYLSVNKNCTLTKPIYCCPYVYSTLCDLIIPLIQYSVYVCVFTVPFPKQSQKGKNEHNYVM